MFSNEHVNYLITYSFDFRNEELLSYYISFLRFVFSLAFYCTGEWWLVVVLHRISFLKPVYFLLTFSIICIVLANQFSGYLSFGFCRAISGKLNRNTVSLLVRTHDVSFMLHECCLLDIMFVALDL